MYLRYIIIRLLHINKYIFLNFIKILQKIGKIIYITENKRYLIYEIILIY